MLPDLAEAISVKLGQLGLAKVVEIENSALPAIAWMEYHDEIIIEVTQDCAEAAKEWLVQCMTDGMSQVLKEVPVVVEAQVKNAWD